MMAPTISPLTQQQMAGLGRAAETAGAEACERMKTLTAALADAFRPKRP